MEHSESPGKLRVNYKLSLKHKKHPNEKPGSTPIIYPRPFSQSPKKTKPFNISHQLAKLQEELDSAELYLQLSKTHSQHPLKSEQKIYKSYMENLIHSITLQDRATGKCLFRGWTGFLSTVNTKKSPKPEKFEFIVNPCKDLVHKEVQVNEDQGLDVNEYLDQYLGSLHSMSRNVNKLQTGNIVEKLNQLLGQLVPINLPSPSESPEPGTVDFIDTVKAIHGKLKRRMVLPPPPPPPALPEMVSAASQTFVGINDFQIFETHKALNAEKEFQITEMRIKVKAFDEIQEKLNYRIRENEELKKQISDTLVEGCSLCKVKIEQLANNSSQLRHLQMSVSKGMGVERELEITKKKLNDSLNVISLGNSKILKLSANVELLTEKVEEAKGQREKLLKKLHDEEKTREDIEVQLHKEVETNMKLQKVVKKYLPENINQIVSLQVPKPDSQHTSQASLSSTGLTLNQSFQKSSSISKSTSKTPTLPLKSGLRTPERQPRLKQTFESLSQYRDDNSGPRDNFLAKPHKMQTIISALGMTKQEYLSLSKKARIELFECLYEHRDKCGPECEHLKRAMNIRIREKGQLFPTKKYNIS